MKVVINAVLLDQLCKLPGAEQEGLRIDTPWNAAQRRFLLSNLTVLQEPVQKVGMTNLFSFQGSYYLFLFICLELHTTFTNVSVKKEKKYGSVVFASM